VAQADHRHPIEATEQERTDTMAQRTDEGKRTLKGGLLILGIIAVSVLVFVLDDIRDAFAQRYTLHAVFPEAADLVVDAPVWLAGKRVGRVRAVELQPASPDTLALVTVTIRLPRNVQPLIRGDSEATLTTATLIGERLVDISTGSEAFPPLLHGDTIGVRRPRDMAALTRRVTALQASLDTMMQAVGTVRELVPARRGALDPAARQLELARAELDVLMRDVDRMPGFVALRDPELRAGIGRAVAVAGEIRDATARATGRAGGTAAELREAIAGTLARADTLSATLALLEVRLQDTDGFIGRMAQDTALPKAVNATRAELDSLIADVRRSPFRFFRLRL
jgi:phospholipid/cholesterol/gamma-HCH transport system substrate-binding protein